MKKPSKKEIQQALIRSYSALRIAFDREKSIEYKIMYGITADVIWQALGNKSRIPDVMLPTKVENAPK